MSRLGKKPVILPSGVEALINAEARLIGMKGPKGALEWKYPGGINVQKIQDASGVRLRIEPQKLPQAAKEIDRRIKAAWGLARSRIEAMVHGVAQGFSKTLEIHGVGFKVKQEGRQLVFSLGSTHPIVYQMPAGINAGIDSKQTQLIISGCDKELVGSAASALHALKPPEPYQGKGVRYSGEYIIRKAGKTAAAAGAGATKK
ncbi:MAG: 50S ribosomal protein L6 [Elusimicrobia bacterium]|nr:50S ribosomal protein L6 [Elusimicrobiota bacterium]